MNTFKAFFGWVLFGTLVFSCDRFTVPSTPAPVSTPQVVKIDPPPAHVPSEPLLSEEVIPGELEVPQAPEGSSKGWWNLLDAEEKTRWELTLGSVSLNWGERSRHLMAYLPLSDGWITLKPQEESDPVLILEQVNEELVPLLSNEEYGMMNSRELVIPITKGEWVYILVKRASLPEGEEPASQVLLVDIKDRI